MARYMRKRHNAVRPLPYFGEMDKIIKCLLKAEWQIIDDDFYFINTDNNYQKLLPMLKMWVIGWKQVQGKFIGDIKLINMESFTVTIKQLRKDSLNALPHELATQIHDSQMLLKTHYNLLDYKERNKVIDILKAEQIRMYINLAINNSGDYNV